MQKEIEVKAKVDNLPELRVKLEALGCIFETSVTHEDTYFVNFDTDFAVFMPNTNFLRIRKQMREGNEINIFFTLKRPQSNELDCIEKSIGISSAGPLVEALVLMGYHEVVKVRKTRTKTRYGEMEICLDEVSDLGSFIEVERITEGDGEAVQNELFAFLETLGISRQARVVNGYDTLVYLKNKAE